MIQIILYAGAIVILFMFVVMLLNLRGRELEGREWKPLGILLLLGLIGVFGGWWFAFQEAIPQLGSLGTTQLLDGSLKEVALRLFTGFMWPFELASLLILLAIVASVVISRYRPAKG